MWATLSKIIQIKHRGFLHFYEVLGDLLTDRKVSQSQLADRLREQTQDASGVSKYDVSRWSNQRTVPKNYYVVLNVAEVFDCDERETAELIVAYTCDWIEQAMVTRGFSETEMAYVEPNTH